MRDGHSSHLNVPDGHLLSVTCLQNIRMLMSKEVGPMCPELQKAKAGDADLVVFIDGREIKITCGDMRKQPEVRYKNRGFGERSLGKSQCLGGRQAEESVGRNRMTRKTEINDEKTVMRNAEDMTAK